MSIPGSTLRTTFWIKGEKVRWSVVPSDENAPYRIYDAAARRLFTIDPGVPSVLVSEVPKPTPVEVSAAGWSFAPIGVMDAGSANSVAGHACERLRATSGAMTYELCAAQGMPTIPFEYAWPNAEATLPFLDALEARGEIPLSVVAIAQVPDGGRGLSIPKLSTIQLRAAALDDARFVVPDFPVTPVKRLPTVRALPR